MADQQTGEVTIIGKGAKLEGTVVSAGSLRIDGQIKGQVNADGDVMLAPQSQVDADIRAQNVSVAGRFKGSIVVKGRAELARGGRVDGNITAKTLVVEEGAIFQGQSIMDQQAAPAGQQTGAQQSAQQQRRENVPDTEGAKV
jgi:cytoskeletal protein CcmA (bactofilin family)